MPKPKKQQVKEYIPEDPMLEVQREREKLKRLRINMSALPPAPIPVEAKVLVELSNGMKIVRH